MNNVRKSLIRDFCHSVVWIDDEILSSEYIESERDSTFASDPLIFKHFTLFQKQADIFYKNGIACSLVPFNANPRRMLETTIASDYYKSICKKSTVLVVDWQLGNEDSGEYCMRLIKTFFESEGLRIIAIYSQYSTNISEKILEKFNNLKERNNSDWLTDDQGKYITIIEKNDSENLAEQLLAKMLLIPHSHLAWIALDLSNCIRNSIPILLNSIPRNTDYGLLVDYFLSGKSNYTKTTILNNLLEDLSFLLNSRLESSFAPDAYRPDNWSVSHDFIEIIQKFFLEINARDDLSHLFKKCIKKLRDFQSKIAYGHYVHNIAADLLNVLSNMKSFDNKAQYIELFHSIEAYSSFCENISYNGSKQISNMISRGVLLQKEPADESFDMLVCISQACDALNNDYYYLLKAYKGFVPDMLNKNKIFFNFQSKLYYIDLKPESLILIDKSELVLSQQNSNASPRSYLISGFLRKETIDRISDTFWKHITRIGVNVPCLDRAFRS